MKHKQSYYERIKEVSGFPHHTHVMIQVFYHAGNRNIGYGAMPKGYYLCVKPVSRAHGLLTYDMDLYTKVFLFPAKDRRFSVSDFRQAIQVGETLAPEKIDYLRKAAHSNTTLRAAA